MDDNSPEINNLTPEEIEAYKILKWCTENPEKIVWVDADFILEDYTV